MKTDSKVQPQTFSLLPWVEGIDTLPNREWFDSNPDGQARSRLLQAIRLFDQRPETIDLIITPLRNLIRIMLDWPIPNDDDPEWPHLSMLVNIEQHLQTFDTRPDMEEFLREYEDQLRLTYPGAPLTIDVYMEHLRVDAEYWLTAGDSPAASVH